MTSSSTAKTVVKDIIIVGVGVAAIWFGLQLAFGTQNPFYVVSSGSMIPVLQVYDVLVVQGHVPFADIKVGDIIVFNRPSGHDRVIVHRVAEILDDNPKTIRTKGDANPGSIPGTDYPLTKEEYIGKVVYVVPQIGYITRVLTPPINYIIIAVIIGIMIVKQYYGKGKKESPKFETIQAESAAKEEFTKSPDTEYSDSISDLPKGEFTKSPDTEHIDSIADSNQDIKNQNDENKT
jgi:signal peptidase